MAKQQSKTESAPATTDRIRTRAYELYEARIGAGRDGDDLSDWVQAEQELSQQQPPAARAPTTASKGNPRPQR